VSSLDSEKEPFDPAADPLTDFFWAGARDHKLLILRCQACGFYVHWPRPICKRCHSFDLTPEAVSGRARLYTYTIGVQAFHPWFETRVPYVLAVAELEEQAHLKLVTNIVDCLKDDLRIGMDLEVGFEEVTFDFVLPVFRPAVRRSRTEV
jgi:uncharacterized OB-fold protein